MTATSVEARTASTVRLLVHARSLLRQSRCPECQASGLYPSDNCEWCKDRATTIAELLSHPTDEVVPQVQP